MGGVFQNGGGFQNRMGGGSKRWVGCFKTEKGGFKLKRGFQNWKGGFKTERGVSKPERGFQNWKGGFKSHGETPIQTIQNPWFSAKSHGQTPTETTQNPWFSVKFQTPETVPTRTGVFEAYDNWASPQFLYGRLWFGPWWAAVVGRNCGPVKSQTRGSFASLTTPRRLYTRGLGAVAQTSVCTADIPAPRPGL